MRTRRLRRWQVFLTHSAKAGLLTVAGAVTVLLPNGYDAPCSLLALAGSITFRFAGAGAGCQCAPEVVHSHELCKQTGSL
jgi:hypothetical protein